MSRDYYADLELPADADTNEIKKQFRKLGKVKLISSYRTSRLTLASTQVPP